MFVQKYVKFQVGKVAWFCQLSENIGRLLPSSQHHSCVESDILSLDNELPRKLRRMPPRARVPAYKSTPELAWNHTQNIDCETRNVINQGVATVYSLLRDIARFVWTIKFSKLVTKRIFTKFCLLYLFYNRPTYVCLVLYDAFIIWKMSTFTFTMKKEVELSEVESVLLN